jgi:hypothetical protein
LGGLHWVLISNLVSLAVRGEYRRCILDMTKYLLGSGRSLWLLSTMLL